MMKTTYNNAIGQLLDDIEDYPVLSYEQENELCRKMRAGDDKARETLILSNVKLVVHLVKQHGSDKQELGYDDLVMEGIVGLTKAVDRWEPEHGKLSTYAAWYIKGSFFSAMSEKGRTIRQPVNVLNERKKIEELEEVFLKKHGYEASDQELSEETGLTIKRIRAMRNAGHIATSIDTPTQLDDYDNVESSWCVDEDAVDPADALADLGDWYLMHELIEKLSDLERDIIKRYYGLDGVEPATLVDLGLDHDYSSERIRQLKNIAVGKLQKMAENY